MVRSNTPSRLLENSGIESMNAKKLCPNALSPRKHEGDEITHDWDILGPLILWGCNSEKISGSLDPHRSSPLFGSSRLPRRRFFLGPWGPKCSGETRHWWRVLAVVDVGFISPTLVALWVIFIGDESIIYSSTVIQPIIDNGVKHQTYGDLIDRWWLVDDSKGYTTLYYIILPSIFGDDRSWAGNPILNPWSWRSNTWIWSRSTRSSTFPEGVVLGCRHWGEPW